jgi:nucleotide-binding universal stress UspA family protein
MYDRILVPLDGTSCSEAALPHAKALAEKFNSELILLRVVEPAILPAAPMPDFAGWTAVNVNMTESDEALKEAAEEYVQQIARQFREQGGVVTEVEWGGAVDQILHSAEEHRADLIVMGTHGRHGIEKLLLGSSTESLLHHARIPLLLVKEPEKPHR